MNTAMATSMRISGASDSAMPIFERTVSVLELLPEDSQKKVFDYSIELLKGVDDRQFEPITEEQMLIDLQKSEEQIEQGSVKPFDIALREIREGLGF